MSTKKRNGNATDEEKNVQNLLKAKPGYAKPLSFALAAVENMAEEKVSVPSMASEDMIRHACASLEIDPYKSKILYEVMVQAAQEKE